MSPFAISCLRGVKLDLGWIGALKNLVALEVELPSDDFLANFLQ